jgi:2-phosphosulfolactate phosphatase
VLPSPNGAACSRYGRAVPYLFIGALVNAAAVGAAVARVAASTNLGVTVIACGERWSPATKGGSLRVAVEDYLGAGAILSYLSAHKSPDACVCEAAFSGVQDRLQHLVWESSSGRELREKGSGADVELAARFNICQTVPVMRGEQLERFQV